MKNFEEFSVGDLKIDSKNSYFNRELLYAQKILDILGDLGQHWAIAVPKKSYLYDLKTNETIEFSPQVLASATLDTSKKSIKVTAKLPYFMEQLVHYRSTAPHFANPMNRVDFNDPQIRGFQQYILLPSGSTHILPIKPVPIETPQIRQEKFPNKATTKAKKIKHQKQKQTGQKVKLTGRKIKDPAEAAHTILSETTSFAITNNELTHPTSIPPETITPQQTPVETDHLKEVKVNSLPKASYVSILNTPPSHLSMAPTLNVKATQLAPVILKDMRLAKSYIINNMEYPLYLFDQPCELFNLPFLDKIKAGTYRRRDTGLPNLVKASLDIHYQVGNEWKHELIQFPKLFLSGAKSFNKKDPMPRDYNMFLAVDLLTTKEQQMIPQQEHGKKSTYVGLCVEHQLLQRIGNGYWGKNHTHSEAIYALWLLNELPTILRNIATNAPKDTVYIMGLISAIQTFQDCCSHCQDLLQCLQGRMKDIINTMRIPNLIVDNNFGTIVLAADYTRHPKNEPSSTLSHDPVVLKQNSHVFVTEPFKAAQIYNK